MHTQHYLNMDWSDHIATEEILVGAPVTPIANKGIKNAQATNTTVWIAKQSATAQGDTSYFQNHITPKMRIGEPIDVVMSGVRTARIFGPVSYGDDLMVDTTNKAFTKLTGSGIKVGVALCDSTETGLHYGEVKVG